MDYFWILLGIAGLYFGGEYLIKGAVGLSLRFGLSPMIVGLTVVAFGTSAPELIVSLRSALAGLGDIAFGNVIGSNIANILLILGLPAIIAPILSDQCDSRRAWFEMMGATALFTVLACSQPFGAWQGAVLLGGFILAMYMQFKRARLGQVDVTDDVDTSTAMLPIWKILAFVGIGIVLLPLGANFLVKGAVNIAQAFGMSEAMIGLTIVAIGTSLPELATSMNAALKGETDVAMGNVIGSCLFNLLLVLGVTGIFSTTSMDSSLLSFDIPVMLATSLALGLFALCKLRITRVWGVTMVAIYVGYLVMVVA